MLHINVLVERLTSQKHLEILIQMLD